MTNSISIRRIITASILGLFLITAVSVARAEPSRGKCAATKAEKKASKPKKTLAVFPGEITFRADASVSLDRGNRVTFHPEMNPVRVDLSGVPSDTKLTAKDESPVKFNGVVRGSNHKNQYVVVAGETTDDSNARYASNED